MRKATSDQLCLDFVNTLAWRKAATPEERMPSPEALLAWCVGAEIAGRGLAAELRRRWRARPSQALALHRRAVELREAIYRIFCARIRGDGAPEDAIGVLNATLAAAPRTGLVAKKGKLVWRLPADPESQLLSAIAWFGADLIAGARAGRVRQCEDDRGCGWLFLDESRAGTRRWCSMGNCGNRAKARRHYLRQKYSGVRTQTSLSPTGQRPEAAQLTRSLGPRGNNLHVKWVKMAKEIEIECSSKFRRTKCVR
jgi:predicted RNA-binding Zn ribbon-like protein